jgi:hypothetical protein
VTEGEKVVKKLEEVIPQKYDLRDDVIALGLNKEDYSELFKEDE